MTRRRDNEQLLKDVAQNVSQGCQSDRVLTERGRSESVNLLITKDKYDIPGTYSEAIESEQNKKWTTACENELKSFRINEVY